MMQLGVYFFLPEVAGVPPYKQAAGFARFPGLGPHSSS